MIEGLKASIRQRVWSILGPPATIETLSVPQAPVGIDRQASLPLHYEPPECPVCIFSEFQCHDCLGTIIDPEAPFGVGFESVTYTHMHIHSALGHNGHTFRVPARRKLCMKCFRLDWQKANPGIPCDL